MVTEKDLELELDIQQIKHVITNCITYFSDTKIKLKAFDETYHSRKSFLISQFKNTFFFNDRWR